MRIKWWFRIAVVQANAVSSYGFTTLEEIALVLCLSKEIFSMFTWQVFSVAQSSIRVPGNITCNVHVNILPNMKHGIVRKKQP